MVERRSVTIYGKEYISRAEAVRQTGINGTTMGLELKNPNNKDFIYTDEKKFDLNVIIGMNLERRTEIRPEDNGCHRWIGSFNKAVGYGQLTVQYKGVTKFYMAHRLVYCLHHNIDRDDLPRNVTVRHTCDNRWCVNPEHLWLGTPKENEIDKNKFMVIPLPNQRSEIHHDNIKDRDRDWLFVASSYQERVKQKIGEMSYVG